MSENSCLNCRLAKWQTTVAGRLHPNGSGRCQWEMPDIKLPACMYYIVGTSLRTVQKPYGGFIDRKSPSTNCDTWEPKA